MVEDESRNTLFKAFFGPRLEKKAVHYLPSHHEDFSIRITQQEYKDLRQQEIDDPRNRRGLI
jgi:hypothetical protein